MAEQGITGECKATLDVSREGLPINVTADCTHPGFIEVTIASAKTLRFEPKIQDGKPVIRQGVVYPIAFELSDDRPPAKRFAEMGRNQDGFLTSDENIAQAWIDKMDTNGDQKADFAEFKADI